MTVYRTDVDARPASRTDARAFRVRTIRLDPPISLETAGALANLPVIAGSARPVTSVDFRARSLGHVSKASETDARLTLGAAAALEPIQRGATGRVIYGDDGRPNAVLLVEARADDALERERAIADYQAAEAAALAEAAGGLPTPPSGAPPERAHVTAREALDRARERAERLPPALERRRASLAERLERSRGAW